MSKRQKKLIRTEVALKSIPDNLPFVEWYSLYIRLRKRYLNVKG